MRRIKQEQFLPITLEQAWAFFATPANLNRITPPNISFRMTSELPDKMYEGLIITYTIRPLLNIPLGWCTEITHLKEGEYFVDEQRSGPYRIWHHEHHFRAVENGVIMTDIVYYQIGWSLLGWLAGCLFVHSRLRAIFKYRYRILESYFPEQN